MSGALLHEGATVICAHAGQAQPTLPDARVSVGGQSVVTLSTAYSVSACPLPTNAGGPCVTAQWIVGATRVLVGGDAALLVDSQSTCVPTGTPLTATVTQIRVTGQ